MLSFKPTFSLSSFTFIKSLFSSSSLSAIRVVSSAYLRLLIFSIISSLPPLQIWFRNRRFKMKKQQREQEQQSLKPPSQVLPAKDVPTVSTNPHSFLLAISDSYNSLSPQPL